VCPLALIEMGSSIREFVHAVESVGYALYRLRSDGTAGERLGVAELALVTLENMLVQAL
jgi:hypothetical protein